MTFVAGYTPSETMEGVMRLAGQLTDVDSLTVARGVMLRLMAVELSGVMARTDSDGDWLAYFLAAPESRAKVSALLQSARADWMRDPS